MTTRSYLLYFSIFFVFGACKKVAVEPSDPCYPDLPNIVVGHSKAGAYQELMNGYVKKGLPGIVLLIEDQEGIWVGSAGKADLAEDIPMQPCHINKTASLTKPFIATLAFKLAEEGILNLDAPIGTYLLPATISKVRNSEIVTTRMLLGHQSGIYDVITDTEFYLAVLNNPNKKWNHEELLDYVEGKEPYFPAGTSAGYSNTNTLLVSMIIDKVTGKNHADLLREKVLGPLNLTNTIYHWHENLPEGRVAQGYFDLYNNGNIVNVSNLNTGNGNGYNGIYSTVGDLYTFTQKLLKERNLVTQASLESMLTFHPQEETGKLLGHGLIKDFIHRAPDQYAFGHRGRDLSCSAEMFYFPEKDKTFILLVNYGNDAESALREVYFEFKDKAVDLLMTE